MANDCWNRVVIRSDLNTLNELIRIFNNLENQFLTLNNYHTFFPNETISSDFDWGSKRLDSSCAEIVNDAIIFAGDSAWSPPLGFYEKLSSYWNVEVEVNYDERGYDFAGHKVWKNGELEVDEEWTYWEYLYNFDKEQFDQEMKDFLQYQGDVEEFIELLNLDDWNDQPVFDLDELHQIWLQYNEEEDD